MTGSNARIRRGAFGLGIAGFLVLPPCCGQDNARKEADALLRRNDLLQKQVELASGKAFYLVLDPGTRKLRLMLRGALLQEYAARGLEMGGPRVAYISRGLPESWQGRVWSKGNLEPPREHERLEIEAPPISTDENEDNAPPVPIPPTPEEAYPVPLRYHVRFAGGLSIEVRPQGDSDAAKGFWGRLGASLSHWWADLKTAAAPEPVDSIRLRLTLDPKDADSLYRALPPDTSLLILPPD